MKKTQKIILLAGIIFAMAVVVFQKTADFVRKGLADSQKIRVAETNSCANSEEKTPNFPGCNSVL